ncbi:hypothetical protein CTAM01_10681 [Colletotrichum tamarilloi]|uniref:Uncharacterized protein n=1 Tax=Colletotrichum tamarilloi TaxID=1209934 RepID=A0ABQ9QZM6_9PEZI|nr:uncharacterized protein CTAM01_10681 [Colletotrichum tamarilloi]KAK1490392.1 hypothetical protein CTAM01_10681 [Colletotrichum tamarilloi]
MLDYQPLGKRESSSSFLADHPVPVPTDNFPGLPTRLRYGGTTYIGLYSPAGSQSACIPHLGVIVEVSFPREGRGIHRSLQFD